MNVAILRKPEVDRVTGRRDTARRADIRAGLFPPPVEIGDRAVGWPAHEVDAIVRARIAGLTDEQIRALVSRLVASRAKLADGLTA